MRRPIQLLLRFLAVTAFGVLSIALIGSQLVPQVAKLPEAVSFTPPTKLRLPTLPEGSTLVDVIGQPVGKLQGTEYRIVVPLDQMSEELKATVLAVEDADFYEHEGVSAKSVLRALRANSESGEVSQGGSTITQQLVKLSLVGNERTIERKVKEASLAIQLEDQLCANVAKRECKDRILQQYLNTIYFGQGAYGVEAASLTYFNKHASEVNYAEAALMASLIRNPTGYDPIRFPDVSTDRRQVAVSRMLAEELINQEQADFINAVPVPSATYGRTAARDTSSLSYVERKVRDELLAAEWLAPTVEQRRYLIFNGGLKITITIDARAQALAEAAIANAKGVSSDPYARVSLVATDPASGAVRAIVGEADVDGKPIELAAPASGYKGWSSGSAFKTFTMIAALEQGYTVNDTIAGDPIPEPIKKKNNWPLGKSYPADCPTAGQQPLTAHLAKSNNCAFMRLQNSIGIDKVKMTAVKLGIDPESLDPTGANPACFTIGCDSFVKPLDMANAYGTIANDGRRNPVHFVHKVEDRDGNVLFEFQPVNEQVISPQVAREAIVAMQGVVTGGTCSRCAIPGQPVAGKTGTDERGGKNINLWFVGFTPHLSTAVWVGDVFQDNDLNVGSGGAQGGRVAGPIWQEFMSGYIEGMPKMQFAAPEPYGGGRAIPDPWSSGGKDAAKKSTKKGG
jgi:penicillin-binding protein 1A